MKNFPAISVIIPLYNSEEYIGDCLNSLLEQTFADFEIIVVDDCSTDSSVEVVRSYAAKFGGRLGIFTLKQKSKETGGNLPRKRGLELSRGKYLFFLDSDDAITPTAFEELYRIAEEFQADVVHCEKFYYVPDEIWNDGNLRQQLEPDNHFTEDRLNVTAPTLLGDDIGERVSIFAEKKLNWNFWTQLIRRDFLLENEITLADAAAQDMVFTICELCCAKRYVVVPNAINFYRSRENSVSTEDIEPSARIHKWVTVIKRGIDTIDRFFAEREELSRRPDLKYILLNTFIQQMLPGLDPVYLKFSPELLDEAFQREFTGGDNVALTAFVFNVMNVYRINVSHLYQHIAELEDEIQQLKSKR